MNDDMPYINQVQNPTVTSWRVRATAADVSAVSSLIERRFEHTHLSAAMLNKILVCLAEALNNIIQHSGARHVLLVLCQQQQATQIELRDAGVAYAPPQPGSITTISFEENGRGWLILHQWADHINYHRHARINRLSLLFKHPRPE